MPVVWLPCACQRHSAQLPLFVATTRMWCVCRSLCLVTSCSGQLEYPFLSVKSVHQLYPAETWRLLPKSRRSKPGSRLCHHATLQYAVLERRSLVLLSSQPSETYIALHCAGAPVRIVLPALSPTMTEGVISKWLVKEGMLYAHVQAHSPRSRLIWLSFLSGDEVSAGDVIFEMETDKATMEVEASDDGVVAKILVPAGTAKTTVNSVVALMVEPGEDITTVEIPADLGM